MKHEPNTYLLIDRVGEHSLPSLDGTLIRTFYNGYDSEQTLVDAGLGDPNEPTIDKTIETLMNLIINKRMEQNSKHLHYKTCDEMDNIEPFDNIFMLRIYGTDAKTYLQHFTEYLINLFENRGADDDYYDYLPSITDMHRQLSIMTGHENLYNDLCQKIYEIEGPEWFTEACYTADNKFEK